MLIALIYRYLPSKRLPWQPVLIGAEFTACAGGVKDSGARDRDTSVKRD